MYLTSWLVFVTKCKPWKFRIRFSWPFRVCKCASQINTNNIYLYILTFDSSPTRTPSHSLSLRKRLKVKKSLFVFVCV